MANEENEKVCSNSGLKILRSLLWRIFNRPLFEDASNRGPSGPLFDIFMPG
jgi:hypothetical protein